MYHLTPFTYLFEGLLGVLTKGVKVTCGEEELARFELPSGFPGDCKAYANDLLEQVGGYVEEDGNGGCNFCRYEDGGEYARGLNVFWRHRWRDFGIVSCPFRGLEPSRAHSGLLTKLQWI